MPGTPTAAACLRAARLALRGGDLESARTQLREALHLRPGWWRAHRTSAELSALDGDRDAAIAHLRAALPDGGAEVAAAWGRLEAEAGDVDAAAEAFAEGLRRDPEDPRCALGVAALLSDERPPIGQPALHLAVAELLDRGWLDPLALAAPLLNLLDRTAEALLTAPPEDPQRRILLHLMRGGPVPDDRVEAAALEAWAAHERDPACLDDEAAGALKAWCEHLGGLVPSPSPPPPLLEVPELTPVPSDETTRQYEAWPYPRWTALPRTSLRTAAERIGAVAPTWTPVAALEGPVRILIAGCGTGRHALDTARRTLHTELLGLDISRTSLSWAERMRRTLDLPRVRFARGSIDQLAGREERFEVIECVGVLHHLADPAGGARALRSLLAPDGVMLLGLYSRQGRRCVDAARALCGDLPRTLDGAQEARVRLRDLQPDHPAAAVRSWPDFFTAPGVVDLLLNARERSYDLPEVEELLDDLGLRFLGFDGVSAAARARQSSSGDPGSLTDWHRFEGEEPDTFRNMYVFWATAQ